MVIAVLADDLIKSDFKSRPVSNETQLIWAESLSSLIDATADVYMDLNFEMDPQRIKALKLLLPKTVIVNSVIHTTQEIDNAFIRINVWPGFLKNDITEVACQPEAEKGATHVFNSMGWKFENVPDVVGMISPRIISMIINEAWYTLGEEVSTKEEIDTAMMLGTNYPAGPFSWGERIGFEKIIMLLEELSKTDKRYTIAPALIALKSKDATDLKY